jgi:hypothetical protein
MKRPTLLWLESKHSAVPGHSDYRALQDIGTYNVISFERTVKLAGRGAGGYNVGYTRPHKSGHKRMRVGLVKTLDEAKALAQRHADKARRK